MNKTLVVGLLFTLALILPMASGETTEVRFTVMNAYGDHITNALVEIQNETSNVCTLTTDYGGYVDCDLSPGENYTIAVSHEYYQSLEDNQSLEAFNGDWLDVGIVLRPRKMTLNLTVVEFHDDGDDWRIPGAKITIEAYLDEYEYIFEGLLPYDKVIFPDGAGEYLPFEINASQKVQYTDINGTLNISDLEVYPQEYLLHVEKEGYAYGCVRIRFDEELNEESGGGGSSGYAVGPYRYSYPPYCRSRRLRETNLVLELDQLEEITFKAIVYDEDNQQFIDNASVQITSITSNDQWVSQTGANGKAIFRLIVPDCFNVSVTKEGYELWDNRYWCWDKESRYEIFWLYNSSRSGRPITPPIVEPPEPYEWNDTLTLIAGVWKLISVPYELVDSDVNAVFPLKPPIGTGDDWVLRYNGTAWENPSMTIDPLKGYWVKSDTNATIELEYAPKGIDDLFPEIELKQGWNMIGHTEDKVQSVPAALYSLYDNGIPSFEIVYRWDGANWEKYIPGVLEEFNWLYPGEGYWIKMKEDRVYTAIDMNTVV
jgi:hypothetical protein